MRDERVLGSPPLMSTGIPSISIGIPQIPHKASSFFTIGSRLAAERVSGTPPHLSIGVATFYI